MKLSSILMLLNTLVLSIFTTSTAALPIPKLNDCASVGTIPITTISSLSMLDKIKRLLLHLQISPKHAASISPQPEPSVISSSLKQIATRTTKLHAARDKTPHASSGYWLSFLIFIAALILITYSLLEFVRFITGERLMTQYAYMMWKTRGMPDEQRKEYMYGDVGRNR